MPWLRAYVVRIAQGVSSLYWGITRTEGDNGMMVKRPANIRKGSREYGAPALTQASCSPFACSQTFSAEQALSA